MELVFVLLVGHFVCDFVLQPDAMGRGKSRRMQRLSQPSPGFPPWQMWLSAHAFTHGGAVFLATGLWYFGAIETVLHAAIDHLKCEGKLSFGQDQACHLVCKAGYALLLLA
jgi:hypothetical protein